MVTGLPTASPSTFGNTAYISVLALLKTFLPFRKLKPRIRMVMATAASAPTLVSLDTFMYRILMNKWVPHLVKYSANLQENYISCGVWNADYQDLSGYACAR